MIQVAFDEAALEPHDIQFLRDWAARLNVSLPELLSRILAAAATGKFYLTGNPAQSFTS